MSVPFPPWPQREIALRDRTYVVREAVPEGPGDRHPAVFVHGLGGSSDNWTDLMGLLRDEVDGIAMDLNGFGHSPPPRDGDYSPAGHARGVAALIEERFDGHPVHLFGNSLGGAVSVQLAARRPELVSSLTLVSAALPWWRPMRTNVHLPLISLPVLGETAFDRYLTLDPARRARATIALCFADPAAVPVERVDAAAELVRQRDGYPYVRDAFLSSLRGLLATYRDRGPDAPWRLAARVDVPVLGIYGRQDKLVDPMVAHRLTRAFRDAEVVVLSGVGHVAQMERPYEVAGAWRESVRRRVTAPAARPPASPTRL